VLLQNFVAKCTCTGHQSPHLASCTTQPRALTEKLGKSSAVPKRCLCLDSPCRANKQIHYSVTVESAYIPDYPFIRKSTPLPPLLRSRPLAFQCQQSLQARTESATVTERFNFLHISFPAAPSCMSRMYPMYMHGSVYPAATWKSPIIS
jgi:hypothetical protein